MSKKKTHEEYLKELKDKNIEVIPLENYINAKTKILHKCTCGTEWHIEPDFILGKRKCGCAKKKTHEEYIKELKDKNIEVIPLENYISTNTKILHKCLLCDTEWYIKPRSVLRGVKCDCNKKGTYLYYLKELKDKNIEVIPLENYINAKTKILHKCTCGIEWRECPENVLKGIKCSSISTNKYNTYVQKLKDKNIEVIPLENYINAKTKILHKCTCGTEWYIEPGRILRGAKCGCTEKSSQEKYVQKLKDKNIEVIPLENYINMKTKILHKCTCGTEWHEYPGNVINGTTCGCKFHKQYVQKLKDKNIEVIPLENYINMKTKILHKCTCGTEWFSTPGSVLKGSKCGCGVINRGINTYKNRKTILYRQTSKNY